MRFTAAARSTLHEMLTLPIPSNDYLTVLADGVVWIYAHDVARTKESFFHVTWQTINPRHERTVWHGVEINVMVTP